MKNFFPGDKMPFTPCFREPILVQNAPSWSEPQEKVRPEKREGQSGSLTQILRTAPGMELTHEVFISGDWSFWYESGPVTEAVIENNFFDNCVYHAFGATQEPLAVFSELAALTDGYYYHGTIRVRNNRFRSAVRPLVSMMSVAEAEVTGNVFEEDDRYPFVPRKEPGYYFTSADSPMAAFLHCGRITDENNTGFRARQDDGCHGGQGDEFSPCS